ncbi:MAG: hypothetical protein QE283_05865 [Rhodoferax sp.]|nr:hypothetical protein [Rhodoferax sp.]
MKWLLNKANSALNSTRSTLPGFGLSWPLLIALFAVLSVLGVQKIDVLADPDTYLHIAVGHWILEHGVVPAADPFSHSLPGAGWIAHEWLAQVALYALYQTAGWAGLGGVVTLVFAGTLAYLTRFLLTRMEPVHALLFAIYAGCMMAGHLLARPHVLAWPLLAVWIGSLVIAVEKDSTPRWGLLALMALWANLHGSFMLGIALACGLAMDATLRQPHSQRLAVALRWSKFIALALVAAMVTPAGWHGIVFPFQMVNMAFSLDLIGEWSSPNFHEPQLLEIWLLLALATACTGRLQLPWVRLMLILALTHLALKHQRNVSLLGLVTPFLVASPLGQFWQTPTHPRRNVESVDRVFQALAASAVLVALLLALAAQTQRFVPAARNTPAAAVDAAGRLGVFGPVLNAYEFGGYLVFRSIPVFLDGRADMYGDTLLQRYQSAMTLTDPATLTGLLTDYHIRWTLLSPNTPALVLLDRMPGWERVYSDAVAVVQLRKSGTPEAQ